MQKKSIQKNAVLSAVKTIVSLIVPLITFPYVSRVLHVEAVGKFNFANSIIGYFVLLAELGIGTYALREGTRMRTNRTEISQFSSEMLVFSLFPAAFSLLLLFCSIAFVDKLNEYHMFFAILSLQIPLNAFGRHWIFGVYEEFGMVTMIQAGVQVLSAVFVFLFVRSPGDVYIYTATCTMSAAAANLVYGVMNKKHVDLKRVSLSALKRHIKPILVIFSATVTTALYVNIDTTMLGWLVGDEAVGLYSTAARVYNIVRQMILAVVTVIIPRLILYAGSENFSPFFSKALSTLALLILPAMTGLFLLSDNAIGIIAGWEYLPGGTSLRLLSVALGCSLFASLFGSGVLLPHMKDRPYLFATVISGVANIVLNFVLIPRFHQDAAAFTTMLAEGLVLLICYWFSRKYISLRSAWRPLLSIGVGCAAIVAVCLLVKAQGLGMYRETFWCVCLSVVAYCIVQLVLKNEVFLQTAASVWRMLSRKKK